MGRIVDKEARCQRIASGRGVCESCREIGISEKTFYRWRAERQSRSRRQIARELQNGSNRLFARAMNI